MDILDELQLIAAQNLERLEVNKYYEVIRELGKGTYGKVDLVIHKIRGQRSHTHRYSDNRPTFPTNLHTHTHTRHLRPSRN